MVELENIDAIIAENLKIARRVRGLTLHDISLVLGVTYQQVQKYESGKSKITIDKLLILTKHLNVKMEFFLKKFEM